MVAKITLGVAFMGLFACSPDRPDINPGPSSDPNNVSVLGAKIDKSEQRAAAAVAMVIENSTKPDVVTAEGKVAAAYLPAPTAEDVAFARDRVAKADKKAYEAQEAYGKKLQAEVTKMWDKMEQENRQSKIEIDALKTQNKTLKEDIVRIEKEGQKNLWTLAGVILFVSGAVAWALLGWKIGAPLILCAPLAGSIPIIINSQYFNWIVGTALAISAGLGIWRLYDYIKDKNNEPAG